ncbi:protein NO VEIN domain-containing protein [Nonlabens agnitus]|uniref:Protein NO VEIN C-terminal domain-containing protein n=1 Tax=Nonlabens agnitus TaxID=870484 RepID=A0A2S9WQS9_9FLAO|nr:DUF3883 domain-containing protein [Nonlabens agnitus]PRP65845.1 hypothetical protein BST86_01430 [Nonlabens agnitus]
MGKLTENRAIELLMTHLENQGYSIESYCLGQSRGYDIVAIRNNEKLLIEVKGAKAHKDSPTKRRDFFNSGQIKTHLGKAIIKCLETKVSYPDAIIAIAHPEDEQIRKAIGGIIPELNKIGIIHYWVSAEGSVELEA